MKIRTLPFGFKLEQGSVVIDPIEAEAVLQIYHLYVSGLGYKRIAKELNQQEIIYRSDVEWNQNMVKRILEDQRYLGERRYPVLVDDADFKAVNAKKADNPYRMQKRRKKSEPEPTFDCQLLTYAPTPQIRRMTNEINRALEKSSDPEIVKPMIFACAAEKYNSIGVAQNG